VLGLAWKLREFSPYPMNIFDGAFRFAFTYVIPIGFFAITYWIWTKGVNSYTGTGS